MGRDKASLEIDGRPLLLRVLDALREVTRSVVVVAAHGQALPPLPEGVLVVRDATPHEGPLVALGLGLSALPAGLDRAFVAATDLPRLQACVVRRMAELGRGRDAAVFEQDGQPQLLCAVYAVAAGARLAALVDRGERSMRALARELAVHAVSAADLLQDPRVRELDPGLGSFLDADTPANLPTG